MQRAWPLNSVYRGIKNSAKGSIKDSYLTSTLRNRKRDTNMQDTEKDCRIMEKIKRTAL